MSLSINELHQLSRGVAKGNTVETWWKDKHEEGQCAHCLITTFNNKKYNIVDSFAQKQRKRMETLCHLLHHTNQMLQVLITSPAQTPTGLTKALPVSHKKGA